MICMLLTWRPITGSKLNVSGTPPLPRSGGHTYIFMYIKNYPFPFYEKSKECFK